MSPTRVLRTAALGLVVLLVAGVAAAQAPAGDRPPSAAERRLRRELGLTDEQAKAVHQAVGRESQAGQPLWRSFREARGALKRMALEGAEEDAIETKITEITDLLDQILDLQVTTLRDIAKVLTPEQRQLLTESLQEPAAPRGAGAADVER